MRHHILAIYGAGRHPRENRTVIKQSNAAQKSNNQNPTNTTFPSHSFSESKQSKSRENPGKKKTLVSAMWLAPGCRPHRGAIAARGGPLRGSSGPLRGSTSRGGAKPRRGHDVVPIRGTGTAYPSKASLRKKRECHRFVCYRHPVRHLPPLSKLRDRRDGEEGSLHQRRRRQPSRMAALTARSLRVTLISDTI